MEPLNSHGDAGRGSRSEQPASASGRFWDAHFPLGGRLHHCGPRQLLREGLVAVTHPHAPRGKMRNVGGWSPRHGDQESSRPGVESHLPLAPSPPHQQTSHWARQPETPVPTRRGGIHSSQHEAGTCRSFPWASTPLPSSALGLLIPDEVPRMPCGRPPCFTTLGDLSLRPQPVVRPREYFKEQRTSKRNVQGRT